MVSFEPGARTAWHTHPLGQTLYVISGSGIVQRDGAEAQPIGAGGIVVIPAGIRHWHGATRTMPMSHLAVAEARDGVAVEWSAQGSERHYQMATFFRISLAGRSCDDAL